MASAQFADIGSLSWTDATFKSRVSAATYAEFKSEVPLSAPAKKEITLAMKNWALEKGCKYMAHMFAPLRTREGRVQCGFKYDSLVDLDFGSEEILKPVVGDWLSPTALFQSETDGSSFPNGGIRATHRAAAFMSWDKKSPPFIIGDCMMVPAAFVTHNGEALDHKTPLLRSEDAVNREGLRLLKNLGDTKTKKVVSNLGWEQEYFLISRDLYEQRPDLINCGRTLFGAMAPRNQEGSENYFAPPYPLAKQFMEEVTELCWKLNISIKVNHNEVAPAQHELSPVFSITSVSADTNLVTLDVMDQIAAKLGLKVLAHEKPFAGVNGNGKHNNWSLSTDSGKNLCGPGSDEESQTDFFAFTAALSYALCKHGDLVRVGVAHAGNDHRLGAQEAPPAIISLYTGDMMEKHIRGIMAGGPVFGYNTEAAMLSTGSSLVEQIQRGLEDRNRTAPFPFCGNRWEFRAVGSSQHCGQPLAYLNTAVADGCAALSAKIEGGMSVKEAIAATYNESINVIFNGNGYSAEWPVEAAARGLLNLKDTPQALATFNSAKNKALFAKMGVFSEAEVESRTCQMYEAYSATLITEGETAVQMVNQKYMKALAADLKAFAGTDLAGERPAVYASVGAELKALQTVLHGVPKGSEKEVAEYCGGALKAQLHKLREVVDASEGLCADWPVPSYETIFYSHQTEGRRA